jgi:hypothetical protein
VTGPIHPFRERLGGSLVRLGIIIFLVAGIWSFVLDLSLVSNDFGFWALLASFLLAPLTLVVAPWYAGIVAHNWWAVVMGYGGGTLALLLIFAGSRLGEGRR